MLSWLQANGGSLLVCIVLALLVFLVIRSLILAKKKGTHSCSCGCSGCAMKDSCHSKPSGKS